MVQKSGTMKLFLVGTLSHSKQILHLNSVSELELTEILKIPKILGFSALLNHVQNGHCLYIHVLTGGLLLGKGGLLTRASNVAYVK